MLNPVHWLILALCFCLSVSCFFLIFFCPESILEVSKQSKGSLGLSEGLPAAVPSCVCLPTERVLHLEEVHGGHGDGWRPFLFEAGLEVEGHQEVLANQQSSAEARHAAQVLQVAPQEDGALALLATVTVHRQHVDVHSGGVWDVLSHSLLEVRDYIEALMMPKHNEQSRNQSHFTDFLYNCILVKASPCPSQSRWWKLQAAPPQTNPAKAQGTD